MPRSPAVPIDVPPYRLSGVVYGTLLNHRDALAALGAAVNHRRTRPRRSAPVLYIKPRNTLAARAATAWSCRAGCPSSRSAPASAW